MAAFVPSNIRYVLLVTAAAFGQASTVFERPASAPRRQQRHYRGRLKQPSTTVAVTGDDYCNPVHFTSASNGGRETAEDDDDNLLPENDDGTRQNESGARR